MRIIPLLTLALAAVLLGVPALSGTSGTAGAVLVTPSFNHYTGPSGQVEDAAEPSIGVNWNTGAVMFQSMAKTFRVTFNDGVTPPTATWANKKPLTSLPNLDPILFTDSAEGRTFAGGLQGECSVLSYSDDDGQTWTQMTNSCAGVVDHESIGSGPWHAPAPPAATHDRAVYYCAQNGYAMCSTSWNGGLTFNNPTLVSGGCMGLHGSIKVGPEGTAYVPFRSCGGRAGFGFTGNNGLTWASRFLPPNMTNTVAPAAGFDPAIAITQENRIYYAWQGTDNSPMVTVSDDGGVTWYNTVDLGGTISPAILHSTFQEVVVGDNDRAAVAFLGTTATGNPHASTFNGVWDLYVSYTYDGGDTWTTVKTTTDPVQRGWICADGVYCGGGRNLLDFMDATVDAKGRVLVGYADGCTNSNGCSLSTGTKGLSTSARGTIARQNGGTGLFSAFD